MICSMTEIIWQWDRGDVCSTSTHPASRTFFKLCKLFRFQQNCKTSPSSWMTSDQFGWNLIAKWSQGSRHCCWLCSCPCVRVLVVTGSWWLNNCIIAWPGDTAESCNNDQILQYKYHVNTNKYIPPCPPPRVAHYKQIQIIESHLSTCSTH